MPQAKLTIKIISTGQVFEETFDDNMSGVAMMNAQARSRELHSQGYPQNNEDDSQTFYSVDTTIAEG